MTFPTCRRGQGLRWRKTDRNKPSSFFGTRPLGTLVAGLATRTWRSIWWRGVRLSSEAWRINCTSSTFNTWLPWPRSAFWPCRECSDDQAVRALAGRSASGKALQYANRCEGPEWVSRVHTRGRGNSQLGAPIACGNIQEKRTARRLGRIHIIRHFGKKNSTSC